MNEPLTNAGALVIFVGIAALVGVNIVFTGSCFNYVIQLI
jgi:hypothetical protein